MLKTVIGGISTDTFTFDLKWLSLHSGVPRLISTESESSCQGVAAGADPCKLYNYGLAPDSHICMECSKADSVQWVFDNNQISCQKNFPNLNNYIKRTTDLHPRLYDKCEAGQYISGSTCAACGAGCAACTSNTVCTSCDWASEKEGADCTTGCSASHYRSNGVCEPCYKYCVNCNSACSAALSISVSGAQVFFTEDANTNYIMCDMVDKFAYFDGTNYQCGNCGSCTGCTKRDGSNSMVCMDSQTGRRYQPEDGGIANNCNSHNGFYYLDPTCHNCGTECKRCLDSNYCFECFQTNNYVLVDNKCEACDVASGNFVLDTDYNPPACIPRCPTNCNSCDGAGACTGCDKSKGYYLEGGACPRCEITNGWFIPAAGTTCLECITGCLECSDTTSCNKCDTAKHYFSKAGVCVFCDIPGGMFFSTPDEVCSTCAVSDGFYRSSGSCLKCSAGNFIGSGGDTCTPCSSPCLTCQGSATQCTSCDLSKSYVLEGTTCALCDTSESKKILDTSSTPPKCLDCAAPCLTCQGTPTNCSSCQTSFTHSVDSETSQGKCTENQKSFTCHSSCSECEGPSENDCRGCPAGKCVTTDGTCEACPGTVPPVVINDPILQEATLTWEINQVNQNNRTRFRIDFSEEEIFFNPNFDIYDPKDELKIELKDHTEGTDYTYEAKWNREKRYMEIIFNFNSTINKTDLVVTLANPEYITSGTGKKPVNRNTTYEFPGHVKISKALQDSVDAIGTASQEGASAGVAATAGALSISSFFTNSLSCFSKLIQIIEFTGMIGLFNFKFDPLLGNYFNKIAKMTEFDMIPFPLNDLVSNLGNSIASQWKGKISETEFAPDYLQGFGFTGILMAAIYPIQLVFLLRGRTPLRVANLRIGIFNSVFMDYLGISVRTLGHYPTNPKTILNTLGFIFATINLSVFVFELIYMQRLVNNERFIKEENLTKIEENMREVFYDGINQKAIETCWFARNYNLLYLLRFGGFAILLINTQYLQIFQLLFSLVIVVSFTVACCYYQYHVEIYETKSSTIVRITQECSISLMIIMTNVFCINTYFLFLDIQVKHFMVVLFSILMILNITLEAVLIIIDVVDLIKGLCKKKPISKVAPEFSKSTKEGAFVIQDTKIKPPENGRKKLELEEGEEEKEFDSEASEIMRMNKEGKIGENNKTGASIDITKKIATKPRRFVGPGGWRGFTNGKSPGLGMAKAKDKLLK